MIRITHLRDVTQAAEETIADVTLGCAIRDLLEMCASSTDPQVGPGHELVTFSHGPLSERLTSYKPTGSRDEFAGLERLATVLQTMTIAHKYDGQPPYEDVDLGSIIRTAAYQARGRQTIVPARESYASHSAILQFAILWLLGKDIVLRLDTPDEIAATLLALEQWVDHRADFAATVANLLAD